MKQWAVVMRRRDQLQELVLHGEHGKTSLIWMPVPNMLGCCSKETLWYEVGLE